MSYIDNRNPAYDNTPPRQCLLCDKDAEFMDEYCEEHQRCYYCGEREECDNLCNIEEDDRDIK